MQTKKQSLIEQIVNIGSGFIISLLVWTWIITPFWGIETSLTDNLGIIVVFTFISIARGYFFRRLFNRYGRSR